MGGSHVGKDIPTETDPAMSDNTVPFITRRGWWHRSVTRRGISCAHIRNGSKDMEQLSRKTCTKDFKEKYRCTPKLQGSSW